VRTPPLCQMCPLLSQLMALAGIMRMRKDGGRQTGRLLQSLAVRCVSRRGRMLEGG
jgi:hypothetical protein